MAKFNTNENWVIINNIEASIKEKTEKYGTKLSEWNVSINRGILTGYNDAFIISTEVKNKLISEDLKSAELIRPYKYSFLNPTNNRLGHPSYIIL